MKIDSDKLFDCLGDAEPEQLPLLTDTEKERIYTMSENKFKNNDIHEEKDNGMTVSGVERYSRPVWKRRLSAVAAAAVILLGTGGGVYLLKNGNFSGTEQTAPTTDAVDATEAAATDSPAAEEVLDVMALAKERSNAYADLLNYVNISSADENDTIELGADIDGTAYSRTYARVIPPADAGYPSLWSANTIEEIKQYVGIDDKLFEQECGKYFAIRNDGLSEDDIARADGAYLRFVEHNGAMYCDVTAGACDDVEKVSFTDEPEIIAQYENEISFNRVLSSDTNEDRIINFALRKCDDGVWRTFGIGPVEEGDDTPSELTQETAEALFTSYNRIVDALESPEYTDTDRSIRYNAILGSNKENVSYTYAPFTHPEYHSGEQFEQDVLMTFSEDCREKTFPTNIYSNNDYGDVPYGETWTDNDGKNPEKLLNLPIGKIFIIRNGELYRIDASPFLPYYYKDRQPEVTILGQNGKTAEIEVKGEPAANGSWLQPFDVTFGLVWEGGNWVINTITPAEGEER